MNLRELFGLIGFGIVVFISTNVDDVLVLLGFFSDPKFRTRQIVIGQFAGIAVLCGVSFIASLISLIIAPAYIGLLGLAPLFLGLKQLWERWTGADEEDGDPEDHEKAAAGHGNILAVAAVTIANGGD
ncbi:MAG: cadmium resistance transporter, partial [Rhizobiaceae bacterium]|nr:cadmium resistance transporter [Rhizobiaceae bacterium]